MNKKEIIKTLDIASFVSAVIAYIYETKQFNNKSSVCKKPKRSLIALVTLAILFVVFTFITPEVGIFRDPITGLYGI